MNKLEDISILDLSRENDFLEVQNEDHSKLKFI